MPQTETYRRPLVLESLPKDRRTNARRDELRANLGFQDASSEEIASLVYPELKGSELSVWSQFLEVFYSRNRSQWQNYVFDGIPVEALEEIETARQLGVFADLEIWTPERSNLSDPLAVGVLGAHGEHRRFDGNARFFMIARWGESLASYDEVFQNVFERNLKGLSLADCGPYAERALRALFEIGPGEGVFSVRRTGRLSIRHCSSERLLAVSRGIPASSWFVCPACGDCKQLPAGA
jgi:hypothetical protein